MPVIIKNGNEIAFIFPKTPKISFCNCTSFINNFTNIDTKAIAKTIAIPVLNASEGKYVGLKNAFQNDKVSVHLPGVSLADNIPVIIAAVSQPNRTSAQPIRL